MSNFRILLLIVAVALIASAAGYATRISMGSSPSLATANGPNSALATALRDSSGDRPGDRPGDRQDAADVNASAEKPLWYWSFEDLDGHMRSLNEWQGPYLVINFWATWCPPCLKEIPSFVALQDQFTTERVQFIGVAYDHAEAVRDFVSKTTINYPVLLGGDDVAVFMRDLGNKIGALPFTAVINSRGQVVATHQGEWHQADAAETLRSLLAKGAD